MTTDKGDRSWLRYINKENFCNNSEKKEKNKRAIIIYVCIIAFFIFAYFSRFIFPKVVFGINGSLMSYNSSIVVILMPIAVIIGIGLIVGKSAKNLEKNKFIISMAVILTAVIIVSYCGIEKSAAYYYDDYGNIIFVKNGVKENFNINDLKYISVYNKKILHSTRSGSYYTLGIGVSCSYRGKMYTIDLIENSGDIKLFHKLISKCTSTGYRQVFMPLSYVNNDKFQYPFYDKSIKFIVYIQTSKSILNQVRYSSIENEIFNMVNKNKAQTYKGRNLDLSD